MLHVIFPTEHCLRDITVLTVLLANASLLLPGIMMRTGRILKEWSAAVITGVDIHEVVMTGTVMLEAATPCNPRLVAVVINLNYE